ncbi:MAG: glycosyltransferase family 4 protein [Nitrospinae bacterium]|nr:glycosyltransferase family 4 protein [Nitrospinota bacterium]
MRIYFLCTDATQPYGGVKKLYRHVDILNKNGLDAVIMHERPGFRCEWFANETPVTNAAEARLGGDDFLVAPEIYGPKIATLARGVRKVVYNQNCYYTFWNHSLAKDDMQTPYTDPEVVATMVVSADSLDYLAYAFPRHKVLRIVHSIDSTVFRPDGEKKPHIAFMPRKNIADVTQVINILKFRGALDGFGLAQIDGKSEAEVAAILRESAFFLSFGYPEGFSLPPAEAMACGCVVLGFHGGGAREFMLPECAYPIPQGDISGFARTVEGVLGEYRRDPSSVLAKGKAAAELIHSRYNEANEERSVLEAWGDILKSAAGGA